MLNILGMIILIIILFIIILLLVGIKVSFDYEKRGPKLKGCLKILIFKKIKLYSWDYPSPPKSKDNEEEEESKREWDLRKMYELAKPCINDFMIYLKSILNIISIARVENHLIFGMDSYADTGKYIGIIWGWLAAVNQMHDKLRLSAEPSFNGSILDGYGVNEVEIYPLKIIVPTLKLLSKKNIRDFLRGVLNEIRNR